MRNSLDALTSSGSAMAETKRKVHHKRLTLVPGPANVAGAQLSNSMADLLERSVRRPRAEQNKLSSSSQSKLDVKSLDAGHRVGEENGGVGDVDDDLDGGRQSEIITRKEKGANLAKRRRKSLASDELTGFARSILNKGDNLAAGEQRALGQADDNTGSGTEQATAAKKISASGSPGNPDAVEKKRKSTILRVLSQADVFENLGKKGSIHRASLLKSCDSAELSSFTSAASAFRSRRETVTSTTTDGFELLPVDYQVRVLCSNRADQRDR